jgi:hypothetical protein
VAASYLDLRGMADAVREREGPDLAEKLAYVLEHRPTLDLAKIPDEPEGDPNTRAPGTFVADVLYAGEQPDHPPPKNSAILDITHVCCSSVIVGNMGIASAVRHASSAYGSSGSSRPRKHSWRCSGTG